MNKKYCIGCRQTTQFKEINPNHYKCRQCGTEVVITPEYEYWAIHHKNMKQEVKP